MIAKRRNIPWRFASSRMEIGKPIDGKKTRLADGYKYKKWLPTSVWNTRIKWLDEINATSPRSLNSDITKSFKCLVNGPRSRELTSTVHENNSQLTLDLSPIYWSHHSRKSINRTLTSHGRGPPKQGSNTN
ncbi:hypothetical protein M5K25_014120 [Dendrobium thyrsiflorum]|uniref:Uncharacterized protein n=1 Tax=Dendrobium thyrsiflorum TaxID=117978 RepID=A0ABD0UUV3_DENTH